MAIAFDAASTAVGTVVSSLTASHTVASGGILLAFAASLGDTPTCTGVTYNGTALTQLQATVDDSGGVLAQHSAWVIHNPSTGSAYNCVASFSSAGAAYSALHVVSYTGVANGSAAATHRTIYHGGSGGLTVVDSQSSDMVVCSAATYNNSTPTTAGSGMTSRAQSSSVGGGSYHCTTEEKSATGASTVMTFTNELGFTTAIGFALIPGSGGASGGGPLVDHSPLARGPLFGAGRLVV